MKAWELLSDESKWCQGRCAETESKSVCGSLQPEAARWCAVGAIYKCYTDASTPDMIWETIHSLEKHLSPMGAGEWNDSATYLEVVSKLKELDI